MEDINFVSGQKPDNKRKDDPRAGRREVIWTKPKIDEAGASEEEADTFEYSDKNSARAVFAPAKKPGSGGGGASGWISKIFSGREKNTADSGSDGDFKKNKELLADHREVVKREKQLRNQEKAEIAPAKHSEGLFSTPVKLEAAKNKTRIKSFKDLKDAILSFGRDKLESSQILKTNLIQGEVTTFFDWKKNLGVLALNLIYAGLVMCVFYVGLVYWESRISERGEAVISKIQEIIPNIKKAEEEAEKINVFQKKVDLVSQLFSQHVYWTNFFKFLEESTLIDAYYIGKFTGDSRGEYSFEVEVADYKSIADQIAVLQKNEFVTDVTVGLAGLRARSNSATGENEEPEIGVVFKLKIKVKPEIFYK